MTTTPPWGTPTSAEPEPAPVVPSGGFVVIVEQLIGSGDSASWRVDPPPAAAGRTRAQARIAALHLARAYVPRHPFSAQGRNVYRIDEDSYVVVVRGMTRSYHFRVSVAEQLS